MNEQSVTIRVVDKGDGQMIVLPQAFRLSGPDVQVSRSGNGLLLEPIEPKMSRAEIDALLAELDQYKHVPFMENGREQPPMPPDDDIPSLDE